MTTKRGANGNEELSPHLGSIHLFPAIDLLTRGIERNTLIYRLLRAMVKGLSLCLQSRFDDQLDPPGPSLSWLRGNESD